MKFASPENDQENNSLNSSNTNGSVNGRKLASAFRVDVSLQAMLERAQTYLNNWKPNSASSNLETEIEGGGATTSKTTHSKKKGNVLLEPNVV